MYSPPLRFVRNGFLLTQTLIIAGYLIFTGPLHLGRYPAAAGSPYLLPWPAGERHFCCQGNRGIVSHRGREEYAYDFLMPVGSVVCAARGGTVQRVVVDHDGHGWRMPNNFVSIDHGDGTVGWYLHLQKNGSLVSAGEQVVQGQPIAHSGHVGRSLAPHLHFQVCDQARSSTLPLSFADIPGQHGVPRMFFRYQSKNEYRRVLTETAISDKVTRRATGSGWTGETRPWRGWLGSDHMFMRWWTLPSSAIFEPPVLSARRRLSTSE